MVKLVCCLKKMKFSFYETSCNKDEHLSLIRDAGTSHFSCEPVNSDLIGQENSRLLRSRCFLMVLQGHDLQVGGWGGICDFFGWLNLLPVVPFLLDSYFAVHCVYWDSSRLQQVWCCRTISFCFSRGCHCVACLPLYSNLTILHMCPNQDLEITN